MAALDASLRIGDQVKMMQDPISDRGRQRAPIIGPMGHWTGESSTIELSRDGSWCAERSHGAGPSHLPPFYRLVQMTSLK